MLKVNNKQLDVIPRSVGKFFRVVGDNQKPTCIPSRGKLLSMSFLDQVSSSFGSKNAQKTMATTFLTVKSVKNQGFFVWNGQTCRETSSDLKVSFAVGQSHTWSDLAFTWRLGSSAGQHCALLEAFWCFRTSNISVFVDLFVQPQVLTCKKTPGCPAVGPSSCFSKHLGNSERTNTKHKKLVFNTEFRGLSLYLSHMFIEQNGLFSRILPVRLGTY